MIRKAWRFYPRTVVLLAVFGVASVGLLVFSGIRNGWWSALIGVGLSVGVFFGVQAALKIAAKLDEAKESK